MKKIIKLILILGIIMSSSLVLLEKVTAQETAEDAAKSTFNNKKLLLLPFYNYADSDKKYLQTYLPELFTRRLSEYKVFEIINYQQLDSRYLGTDINYKEKNISDLLKKNGITYALAGRYIIHNNVIKLDLKVLSGSQMLAEHSVSGKVTDDFLDYLDNYVVEHATWVIEKIYGIDYLKKLQQQTKLEQAIDKIKTSKLGQFFSNKWVFFAGILILFYFFSRFIVFLFEKVLMKLAKKTETHVDDHIVAMAKKPVKWIIIFLGFKSALYSLELNNQFVAFLNNLFGALIIAYITYIFIKSSDIIIREWGRVITAKLDTRIEEDLVPLFVNIARVTFASIGILMMLSQFKIDIAPLIASLGIVGFAVGFAVKDSLSNIIGGIFLILDHSFAVGDKVEIDGDLGVIREVGLRNTKLQTFDNEIIIIPNGELIKKKYKNSVLPDPKIRVVVNFGVAYGTNVDHVEEVVLKALRKIEKICDDPTPQVVFIAMADFALNFQAKIWVPDYVNQYDKWIETTKVVYNALNEAKIEIPFPTQTLYMHNDGK